jgi:CHAT domain
VAISYLDFDLLIERAGQRYRATVQNSPAGQALHEFRLPFTEQELRIFVLELLAVGTRRNIRAIQSPEMKTVKDFGRRLFNAVFDDEVHACLLRSRDESRRRGSGLRIRLHLAEAKPGKVPLAFIPWEFLYEEDANAFLCASDLSPVVRYPDLPQMIQPLAVQPPLRILAMISSPGDYPRLDVEAEWSKLERAVGDLVREGVVALERVHSASLEALQRRLRRFEPCHIFHFIGHGGFDQRAQDGVVVLEDESGRGTLVSGELLGQVLHNHPSLRLAVLNACEGARSAATDPFAGVAQTLVQRGIPAVIAMQFEITDRAALVFSEEFYLSLADGLPVDAAVAQARTAIMTRVNVVEWATPVLYMRSDDGRIFDVEAAPPARAAPVRPIPPVSHPEGEMVIPSEPPPELLDRAPVAEGSRTAVPEGTALPQVEAGSAAGGAAVSDPFADYLASVKARFQSAGFQCNEGVTHKDHSFRLVAMSEEELWQNGFIGTYFIFSTFDSLDRETFAVFASACLDYIPRPGFFKNVRFFSVAVALRADPAFTTEVSNRSAPLHWAGYENRVVVNLGTKRLHHKTSDLIKDQRKPVTELLVP